MKQVFFVYVFLLSIQDFARGRTSTLLPTYTLTPPPFQTENKVLINTYLFNNKLNINPYTVQKSMRSMFEKYGWGCEKIGVANLR
jgi:hypothetical protein